MVSVITTASIGRYIFQTSVNMLPLVLSNTMHHISAKKQIIPGSGSTELSTFKIVLSHDIYSVYLVSYAMHAESRWLV